MTGKTPATVPTVELLAQELGVSRETVWRWRKNPAYAEQVPKPAEDGSHDVLSWHAFVRDNGLGGYGTKGADTGTFSGEYNPEGHGKKSLTDWRAEEVAERVKRLQIENGKAVEALLVADELEAPLGATLLAIQNALESLPYRVAPRLMGIADAHEIARIIGEEIECIQRTIHIADFFPDLQAVAAQLPMDDESERLLATVTFTGQDRAALNALIAIVARKALAELGAKVIQAASSDDGPEIPEQPEAGE